DGGGSAGYPRSFPHPLGGKIAPALRHVERQRIHATHDRDCRDRPATLRPLRIAGYRAALDNRNAVAAAIGEQAIAKEGPGYPGLAGFRYDIYPLDEERRPWLANRPRPHLARQKAPHVAVGGEPHVACGIDAEAPAPLLDIKPRRFARFMPRIRLRVILLMLHHEALEHAA